MPGKFHLKTTRRKAIKKKLAIPARADTPSGRANRFITRALIAQKQPHLLQNASQTLPIIANYSVITKC